MTYTGACAPDGTLTVALADVVECVGVATAPEEPTDEPTEEPTEQPIEQPVEEPSPDPSEQPTDRPVTPTPTRSPAAGSDGTTGPGSDSPRMPTTGAGGAWALGLAALVVTALGALLVRRRRSA